jgi:hypothetical protein
MDPKKPPQKTRHRKLKILQYVKSCVYFYKNFFHFQFAIIIWNIVCLIWIAITVLPVYSQLSANIEEFVHRYKTYCKILSFLCLVFWGGFLGSIFVLLRQNSDCYTNETYDVSDYYCKLKMKEILIEIYTWLFSERQLNVQQRSPVVDLLIIYIHQKENQFSSIILNNNSSLNWDKKK